MSDGLIKLVVDFDNHKIGCVLLQSSYGCNSRRIHELGFDTICWATYPTDTMRKVVGTEQQWRKAAEIFNKHHRQLRELQKVD